MVMVVVLLMVRNEQDLIRVTLDTVKDFPLTVLYDTGSTDDTLTIVRQEYPGVQIYEGTFTDFATTRNEMLRLADNHLKDNHLKDEVYYLAVDAGDEVRLTGSYDDLASTLAAAGSPDAYLVPQVWESHTLTRYYNTRLFRSHRGLVYQGKVHEYLRTPHAVTRKVSGLEIYQDRRRRGCGSSIVRWKRDLELLSAEVVEDPSERAWFYLAQTHECLGHHKEALHAYKMRSDMAGFHEERFVATLRVGNLHQDLGHPWSKSLAWYIRAFDLIERAEPLVKIAAYYVSQRRYKSAWWYLRVACDLSYPTDILFVDKDVYDYQRWHLMGIAAWYCDKLDEGRDACLRAIRKKNLSVDKNNLQFYKE